MKSTRFVVCSAAIALASFFALVRTVDGRDFWQERATAERVSRDGVEERLAAAEEARVAELAALKARIGGLESELAKARGAAVETEKTNAALVSARAEIAKCREAMTVLKGSVESEPVIGKNAEILTILATRSRVNQVRINRRIEPAMQNTDHRGQLNQGVEYVEPGDDTGGPDVDHVGLIFEGTENVELNQGTNYVDPQQEKELVEYLLKAAEDGQKRKVDSDCKLVKLVDVEDAPIGKPVAPHCDDPVTLPPK